MVFDNRCKVGKQRILTIIGRQYSILTIIRRMIVICSIAQMSNILLYRRRTHDLYFAEKLMPLKDNSEEIKLGKTN